MPTDIELLHNIRVYGWIRMLMMRVYLPLIAIYLVEVGHLTLKQLGLLGAITAVTSLAANVPTGYLADKWTRKAAIFTGSLLLFTASALYASFPMFAGAVTAVFIESLGYSIISGAGEAMIHDTLVAMDKAHDYIRTVGRAQSFGLVGNIVLVGLVPLTYGYNKRLPFILGALASLVFVYIASTLVEPPRPAHTSAHPPRNLYRTLRVFVDGRTILFFIALGLLSAAYKAFPPFTNLAMKNLGISPSIFGIIFAAASVVGAINGRFIHYLKRFTLLQYALFDLVIEVIHPLGIGLTHNPVVAVVLFIVDMGFWRVRPIIYQDQLLRRFGDHHHKATLISTLGFFESINFWLGPVFAMVVSVFGYYKGFVVLELIIAAVLAPLFILAIRRFALPGQLDHEV